MVNKERLFFPKGEQRAFIIDAQQRLTFNISQLANLLNISVRTLSDWKREKFSMRKDSALALARKAKLVIPPSAETRTPYWYVAKGSKIGGQAVYKKYGQIGGDSTERKKKWFDWWEREGKYKKQPILQRMPIRKPRKSKDLAEFIGILIGDGGLTDWQVTISLHLDKDKEYASFIKQLIEKLFCIAPKFYLDAKNSTRTIVVSRRELIYFLTKDLGLIVGNKIHKQIDVPDWIKDNQNYKIASLRGLIDTDGCIVLHQYAVKGKKYCYRKILFTSASKPLIDSVLRFMRELNFNPRLSRDGRNVWLDSQKDVTKYFALVGSHNPKHLKRYVI